MKKHDNSLFKIGEIVDILGVTRKTILVYEEMGLLTPAVKDEKSGYPIGTSSSFAAFFACLTASRINLISSSSYSF